MFVRLAPPFCEEEWFGGSIENGPSGESKQHLSEKAHTLLFLFIRLFLLIRSVILVLSRIIIAKYLQPEFRRCPRRGWNVDSALMFSALLLLLPAPWRSFPPPQASPGENWQRSGEVGTVAHKTSHSNRWKTSVFH